MDLTYDLPPWTNLEAISVCYADCFREGGSAMSRVLGRMKRVSGELVPIDAQIATRLANYAVIWCVTPPTPYFACQILDDLIDELKAIYAVPVHVAQYVVDHA